MRQVAYCIKGIQLFRLQQQNAFDLIIAVRHDQLCCKAAHKRQHIRPVTHNAAYAVLQNREHDRCLGDHVFLLCQRIHLGFQRVLLHLKAFFGIFQFCLHRYRSRANAKRQEIIIGIAALPQAGRASVRIVQHTGHTWVIRVQHLILMTTFLLDFLFLLLQIFAVSGNTAFFVFFPFFLRIALRQKREHQTGQSHAVTAHHDRTSAHHRRGAHPKN